MSKTEYFLRREPPIGWSEWTGQYGALDEYSDEQVCQNCEAKVNKRDHHGIEDCVKSLAKRVRILFERKP